MHDANETRGAQPPTLNTGALDALDAAHTPYTCQDPVFKPIWTLDVGRPLRAPVAPGALDATRVDGTYRANQRRDRTLCQRADNQHAPRRDEPGRVLPILAWVFLAWAIGATCLYAWEASKAPTCVVWDCTEGAVLL